jgi:prepilin-type N-terminal cleavage/methylation domain-containing protein
MIRRSWPRRPHGFTLTELAVVTTIIGLLLATLMYSMSAQVDQRDFEETRQRLQQARDLVVAFAIANGRLPCPARYVSSSSNSQGLESFCSAASGACGGSETTTVQTHGNCSNYYDGYLPAASIGFGPTDSAGFAVDAWNNRIRYVVTGSTPTSCATAPTLVFTSATNMKTYGVACQPPDILLCRSASGPITGSSCITSANQAMASNLIAAVVFSTGKNSSTASDAATATSLGRTDEAANLDGNASFVVHTPTGSDAANGEFDDQFLWITAGEIYNRLVAAGLLP